MNLKQTPIHEHSNPDLLRLIPTSSRYVIEVGCSSGALARDFKKSNPDVHYFGIEIDAEYAEWARRHCDEVVALDIQSEGDAFWASQTHRDCWVFGDVLEHLYDPWAMLRKIREVIPRHGSVVACIPNMQHWSIQARLCIGDLRYQDSGLMDRTHLRWFSRQTIVEMFTQTGFAVKAGVPRIFAEPQRDKFIPLIRHMAEAVGADPNMAEADALPLQYVVVAQPA